MVGMQPRRTVPCMTPLLPQLHQIRASESRLRARATISMPTGVSDEALVIPLHQLQVHHVLQGLIPVLRVDWLTWQALAARLKFLCSSRATRYWSCFRLGQRCIGETRSMLSI